MPRAKSLLVVLGPLLVLGAAAAPAPAQAACDTSWDGTTGNWTDASHWSAGVPTSAKAACITAPGTYKVTEVGTQSAAALTLGGTGNAAELMVSGSIELTGDYTQFTNSFLALERDGTAAPSIDSRGKATLAGELTVIGTSSGSHRIVAAVSRTGTFDRVIGPGAPKVLYDDKGAVLVGAPAGPAGPPAPVLGKRVDVTPVRGAVTIRLKGTTRFVALTGATAIPTGSEIDTTRGTVSLASAGKVSGTPQTAQFRGGRFVVSQTRASPVTTATLSGTETKACPSARGASAAAKRRPTRRLFGSGKGLFTTKGHYGSASIRGTSWEVQDFCDRTVVQDIHGSVSVRDLVKRKTLRLKTGQSYTAKAS
jgi:hypothetical protein